MMVNVKKNTTYFRYFVILLTFSFFISCKTGEYYNYKVEGKKIGVTDANGDNDKIETYIAPYRENITKDLDNVLAFSPETLDKSKGKWQTTIGNLLAKVVFDLGNPIFEKREQKRIDFCLLNHGGIRSIIPQGDVTTRTAFEVMPFENTLIVVGLTGKKVKEMADYFMKENKPHPLYGIEIHVDKNTLKVKKIEINGKEVEDDRLYYVATNDYLANGGDSMIFFRDSDIKFDLDYKLRNILIDYFKKVDILPILTDEKIILE
ncbi:5'-nucleotidase C-terminal domain-containing protein [Flavobacterium ardleyense]|uniref:5'-nucleotidase C-terminal domain-containing protein n=1 Tax=Flavobacterium ardleyense TaxID=2038737 RepID=A0ABW5Z9N4_9FLAO